MKVYFDSQIFFLQKAGGVSNYFCHIIKQFIDNPSLGIQPVVQISNLSNIHLRSVFPNSNFPTTNSSNIVSSVLRHSLKKPKNLAQLDLVHFTYYIPNNILRSKSIKKVSTIHDFIPENYFSSLSLSKYSHFMKSNFIEKSDGLIFVSKQTERLAKKRYMDIGSKITQVIHHGVDIPETKNIEHRISVNNFILYVGKRGNYKNFMFLLKCFAEISKFNNISLVCFGGERMNRSESKFIKENNLINRVLFTNDNFIDIGTLYQQALCYINPSVEEGFGMTNLEALANKCPVICSDIPVFREILGNFASYFNPFLATSLINCLNEMILYRQNLNYDFELLIRSKEYTWYDTAKKTANFYKSLF